MSRTITERRRCDHCQHVHEAHGETFPPEEFYGWAVTKTLASDGWVLKRRDLCPSCAKHQKILGA